MPKYPDSTPDDSRVHSRDGGSDREEFRVRGQVQGVGFRPTVWRLARQLSLVGSVWNDSAGVVIRLCGPIVELDRFVELLYREMPPLAVIDSIERTKIEQWLPGDDFIIDVSRGGSVQTGVVPDAATCPACLEEVMDPSNRRHRYPFTNCTHCGPRLSIVRTIPYDRANTSMAAFTMCPECEQEYANPADRRFHAQPNACSTCGPQVWLEDSTGEAFVLDPDMDEIATTASLIRQGKIIAIKGIGGFHLACDATNSQVVDRLRRRKRRYHKAFALMGRDVAMLSRYVRVGNEERKLLQTKAAPIVVMDAAGELLPPGVAMGQQTLGFMLPYTPLHHLLMDALAFPIVLTSGNRSDEPQCIDNQDAHDQLREIADYWLLHDRDIVNRLDDSVLRLIGGEPRFLRRARGYAPESLPLPPGIDETPQILAMGGELKNTFCLIKGGRAVLSQHMGDLEDLPTFRDYRHNLDLYQHLYELEPDCLVVDRHPEYLSTKLGYEMASKNVCRLIEVHHHHAHIVSVMAEYGLPLESEPVLGVALDGLGFGDDGTLWGGEFLRVTYNESKRLGYFDPVPLLGGEQANYEPWRNTYAHLSQSLGWDLIQKQYPGLELVQYLATKPLETLDAMAERGINSPYSSSCGRLFDAVAAAIGLCRERVSHEGEAAIELETAAMSLFQQESQAGYPVELDEEAGIVTLKWATLWQAILKDLSTGVEPARIAARFHHALAKATTQLSAQLCRQQGIEKVVLSGGVFQNRLLLEQTSALLEQQGLQVLSPTRLPANDGGISFGQALIAVARLQ